MNGISPSVQGRGGAHDLSRMVPPSGEFNLSITFDRGDSVVVDADMFGNLAKNSWCSRVHEVMSSIDPQINVRECL